MHLFDCTTISLDNKSFVLKMCKKKDVIMTSPSYILRIRKEFAKTVVTILVKTAILIYFVRNNAE